MYPGIGPAVALSAFGETFDIKNIDFEVLAQNYLWASGEAIQIVQEVAAMNLSRNRPEYFYSATGILERQRYRITYVPALLIVGLVTLFGAALTTRC